MNRKWLWLLWLPVLVACGNGDQPGSNEKDGFASGQLFLPDFQSAAVTGIYLRQGGRQIQLQREGSGWRLLPEPGFPASQEAVERLLVALSTARIRELKTARPEWYRLLQVSADTGTLVRLQYQGGERRLILGSLQPAGGQYWRRLDQPAVAWVDQQLSLSARRLDWMQRTIIDLPARGVVAIGILSASRQAELLRSAAGDWYLGGQPEAALPRALRQLEHGLSQLTFDAVEPLVAEPGGSQYRFDYRLHDGALIRLYLDADEQGGWCRVEVHSSVEADERATEMNASLGRWRYRLSPQRTALFVQAVERLPGEGSDEI